MQVRAQRSARLAGQGLQHHCSRSNPNPTILGVHYFIFRPDPYETPI